MLWCDLGHSLSVRSGGSVETGALALVMVSLLSFLSFIVSSLVEEQSRFSAYVMLT